jgi:hypothetical protein
MSAWKETVTQRMAQETLDHGGAQRFQIVTRVPQALDVGHLAGRRSIPW